MTSEVILEIKASEFLETLSQSFLEKFPKSKIQRGDGAENYGLIFSSPNPNATPIHLNLSKCLESMDIGAVPFFEMTDLKAEVSLAQKILIALANGSLTGRREYDQLGHPSYLTRLELEDGTEFHYKALALLAFLPVSKRQEAITLSAFGQS